MCLAENYIVPEFVLLALLTCDPNNPRELEALYASLQFGKEDTSKVMLLVGRLLNSDYSLKGE